jgi:membrane protease subunit HflC
MLFALGELKTVVTEPGLHFKLPAPLQNVVYLDKRILTLDASGADLVQTSEKKNLMIDTFVKWRIGDARRYWVSFQGSERAASDRLAMLLRDVLNIAVNKRTVNQITSSEREKAMAEISELLQARVKALGIDIVDVRMKRVDFTPEISESVYSRMEAERKRVASEERSKGAAQAERIRAGADRQSEVILAEAYRDAQKTKGEGDGEAARIYADAFGKDPEFARFYRSLVDGWEVLLLSLGWVLVFEGISPLIAPERWLAMLAELTKADPRVIRAAASVLVALGLVIIWSFLGKVS